MSKSYFVTAAVALATFAAVAFIQREVFPVPVLGKYLPN